MNDVLTSALVAASVSFLTAVVTAFVTLRTSERKIQIENITQERAKWRDKIRTKATDVQQAAAKGEVYKLEELRHDFALNLNPFCEEDRKILETIDNLKNVNGRDKDRLEFSDRLTLLLKHDWERAKQESQPWTHRVLSRPPIRRRYKPPLERDSMRPDVKCLRVLRDGNGLLLALAAACALFLFVPHHRHWLAPYPNDLKLAVWSALLLFACLWVVRLLDVLISCLCVSKRADRSDKPEST